MTFPLVNRSRLAWRWMRQLPVAVRTIRHEWSARQQQKQLKAYRQTIKVYDIFTFFNELELLEIRLNILDPFVDYFVIVESTQTFSGEPKELIFQKNQHLFAQWQHKIIHYVIDDTPANEDGVRQRLRQPSLTAIDRQVLEATLQADNFPKDIIHWLKEFYQKESIKKALVGLRDQDICFVSDVDEIWNPDVLIDFTRPDIFKLRQLMYSYYVNNRSNEPWAGTIVTQYKNIRTGCLNYLRVVGKTTYTYVRHGGWHFTNQGGAEKIREKIEASYSADDFNTDQNKTKIMERISENTDYLGRHFRFWIDETDLPEYLLKNRQKYSKLFKPADQS